MADSISDLQKDTFYWQRLLRLAGYYHGAIDGIPGNGTRNGTLEHGRRPVQNGDRKL